MLSLPEGNRAEALQVAPGAVWTLIEPYTERVIVTERAAGCGAVVAAAGVVVPGVVGCALVAAGVDCPVPERVSVAGVDGGPCARGSDRRKEQARLEKAQLSHPPPPLPRGALVQHRYMDTR